MNITANRNVPLIPLRFNMRTASAGANNITFIFTDTARLCGGGHMYECVCACGVGEMYECVRVREADV